MERVSLNQYIPFPEGVTMEPAFEALKIFEACKENRPFIEIIPDDKSGNNYFAFLCALGNVFEAGRIKGIREERSKRKGRD